MTPLPIDRFLPEVVARLRDNRSLVLVAPPGAGKTTRVPPAVLRGGLLSKEHPNLVMLQPRRVAARASAERIAAENGWELGREAGYHVRFDKKLGPDTRIRVLTEGILTRQLLADPFLEGVGAVLLDEFHERSLHTDVTVALLREVQQTVREDLILLIMSATLEAEPAARFLGGCPIVRAEGRTYPIEIEHHPQAHAPLSDRVAAAVTDVLSTPDSSLITPHSSLGFDDVLVFLPGAEEIRRTMKRLEPIAERDNLLLLPLHGSLPPEEQTRALRPADRRKVILATNIAETSLTIDGVRTVVDSGFARVAGYDPRRGLDRLELKRISKASATQRAGRAGRTAPGRCIRLWSQKEHVTLADFDLPEIQRVDLAGTVLALHAWGKPDPRAFGWYESPPEEALAAAERLLTMLGALTSESNGQITPLGNRLMSLPVHPRLARLLVTAAEQGMAHEGATIAALLSEKDISRSDPQGGVESRQAKVQGDSDLTVRMQMLEEAERYRFAAHLRDRGIDPIGARQVARTRDELLRVARRLSSNFPRSSSLPPPPGEGRGEGASSRGMRALPAKPPHPNPLPKGEGTGAPFDRDELLLKFPLLAYPDRVCRRRASDPKAAAMVGGGGVRLGPESCVWQPEFFVALDARHDERNPRSEAVVRIASAIEVDWLEELFPQSIRQDSAAVFDEARGKVVGLRQTLYRDLLLAETRDTAVSAEQAAHALAAALRPQARAVFEADESALTVLARVALLREQMSEYPWPAFADDELAEILAEASHGKRGLDDLRRASLAPLLLGRLHYPLDRLLEQHAPTAIEVPTGNHVKLVYAVGAKPVLAVRLQELFGWTDTPRIAGGRIPVVLHLLGPNYRPVQITEDLRSFWTTTYFQVRKDLRVRYPKHSWPEDPLTAEPTARGGRRR